MDIHGSRNKAVFTPRVSGDQPRQCRIIMWRPSGTCYSSHVVVNALSRSHSHRKPDDLTQTRVAIDIRDRAELQETNALELPLFPKLLSNDFTDVHESSCLWLAAAPSALLPFRSSS